MKEKTKFEEMLEGYQINEKVYVKKKFCDHQGNHEGWREWMKLHGFAFGFNAPKRIRFEK